MVSQHVAPTLCTLGGLLGLLGVGTVAAQDVGSVQGVPTWAILIVAVAGPLFMAGVYWRGVQARNEATKTAVDHLQERFSTELGQVREGQEHMAQVLGLVKVDVERVRVRLLGLGEGDLGLAGEVVYQRRLSHWHDECLFDLFHHLQRPIPRPRPEPEM